MKKTITIEHELDGKTKVRLYDLKMMVSAANGLVDSSEVEIEAPKWEQDGPHGGWVKGYIRITGQEADRGFD